MRKRKRKHQVVVGALGISGTGAMADLPLIIAFVILAALYLLERPARAGLDRNRQGHPDLHHRVRRGHRHSRPARRL
jgi:hypothetical protein